MQPGASVLERFTVQRSLTAGGMGELWLAHDGADARHVVLKTVRADLVDDDEVVRSFEREIEVTARLAHDHVAQYVAHGAHDGQPVLALEHIAGVSLADIAHAQPRLPVVAVASIASEILDALDYVHTLTTDDGLHLGLVHGDVSPHNILVGRDGRATLIDFGAVAMHGDESPVVVGKPGYVSPEQSRGDALDAWSDQYSLGIVLWELLTGTSLFDDDARRRGRTIPPIAMYVDVPNRIERAVLRMLSFDARDRFASCAEACEAFVDYADRAWLAATSAQCRPVRRDWRNAKTAPLAL